LQYWNILSTQENKEKNTKIKRFQEEGEVGHGGACTLARKTNNEHEVN
jgi:hypothetical protein